MREMALYHHGIKGQKWGVRRYQNPDGSLTSAGRERYGYSENRTIGGKEKVGMSADTAAVLLTYSALYIGIPAAIVAKNRIEIKREPKKFEKKYYETRDIENLESAPRQDPSSMSMEEHMKTINPDYPGEGSTQNCMFCTSAMAMRMKGYDVKANKCPTGWRDSGLASTFDNFKAERVDKKAVSASQLNDVLSKQGDGAYGNLMVYGIYGGGHSIFYKVENGKTTIYDCQSNEKFDLASMEWPIAYGQSEYIRLDDKEPQEMVLGTVRKV